MLSEPELFQFIFIEMGVHSQFRLENKLIVYSGLWFKKEVTLYIGLCAKAAFTVQKRCSTLVGFLLVSLGTGCNQLWQHGAQHDWIFLEEGMPHICMLVCVYLHALYYNCVRSAERQSVWLK